MKLNKRISSQRSKARKRHFQAPAHIRRKMMSSPLSKELRQKYKKRALPVQKDDEVAIIKGDFKGREGKVVRCYRKKWVLHIERVNRDKANGTTVPVGIRTGSCILIKLRMDERRKRLLDPENAEPRERKPRVKGRIPLPGEELVQLTPRQRLARRRKEKAKQRKAEMAKSKKTTSTKSKAAKETKTAQAEA